MKNNQGIILGSILLVSCINFLYAIYFFEIHRYLPVPFFIEKSDTFMDFYNTLYWSKNEGIYDTWGSVYPPLNFLLLKIFHFLFVEEISGGINGFVIRGSSGSGIIPLLVIFIISLIAAVRISFNHVINLKKQVIIFFILLLSPPFLFAVERGNLIIICIPALSWYIFSKSQLSRSVALAVLINLKPYFFIIYIIQLINKNTFDENRHFIFLLPIFSLILFLITGLLLNQEFYLMPVNLMGFAANSSLISPAEALSFPSTINAFSYFRGLVTEFRIPPILGYLLKFIVYIYLIKVILLIYKEKLEFDSLAFFSIIFITNYSTSTGGYGLLYYVPALALLYKKRNWVNLAIIVIAMYIGVWDLIPIYHFGDVNQNVFLSDENILITNYVGFGSLLRPIANFVLLVLFYKNLKKRYLYAFV